MDIGQPASLVDIMDNIFGSFKHFAKKYVNIFFEEKLSPNNQPILLICDKQFPISQFFKLIQNQFQIFKCPPDCIYSLSI